MLILLIVLIVVVPALFIIISVRLTTGSWELAILKAAIYTFLVGTLFLIGHVMGKIRSD